jgi:basic amino acid/polyamine antiporter, APA family
MTTPREATELRRSIGLFPATAMVVGIIVGASIFVQPSLITGQVPSVAGVFAVWIVAGVLTLIGSLVAAELSSAYPQTGGVYVFLREAFSPALGFLWGWAMFWSMHSGIVAAISMVFARYVAYFIPLGDMGIRIVAIGAIAVLSLINVLGVQYGAALQTASTAVKLVAVVLVIILGLVVGVKGGLPQQTIVDAAATGVTTRGFVIAVIAGLFAYGGWHMVTYAAGETVDPRRTIPRALMIGTLLVTGCYIALNAAYLAVLPMSTVSSSTRIAADFADAVMGSGAAAMSVLVILSTIGAANGVILAGPRVYLSMARDRLLFGWIGAVHPRFLTPHRAILLQAVWSSVLVATGTYRQIFTRVVYTEWIFFGLMAAAVYVLRRRPDYQPAYRAWGYPVLPAVFIVSTALIVLNQIYSEPVESATGLALVLAGLPVYYLWIKRRNPGDAARENR